MSRRLAAILVADAVGYSQLMGRDETGTLARFAEHRRETVEPALERHGGRVFKTMGDALLVEFASTVAAVACAVELAEPGSDGELRFRFGIHVGDVVDQDGDLFGDAVNIAARIEALAEPGGIVLSEDAARQVRGKLDIALTDIGPRTLKNIAEPVRIFALGEVAVRPEEPVSGGVGRRSTLALVPLQHRGDPDQAWLTEGLSEALSIGLAPFDAFDLVEEQGSADFLLDGSLQAAGQRARVSIRLDERATGRRVWGTTFDRTTDDPFTFQDDLVATIACTMGEAIPGEAARALDTRPVASWTAQDHVIDATRKMHRLDAEGCRMARQAIERAMAIAPGAAAARNVLGWIDLIESYWVPDRRLALERAGEIARQLVREDERFCTGWRLLSRVQLLLGRTEEAVAHARRAREINPHDSDVMVSEASAMVRSGHAAEGLPLIERAVRVNPYAPTYYQAELALAQLLTGAPEQALATVRNLTRPQMHSRQTEAVTLVTLGRIDEARRIVEQHLEDIPHATATELCPIIDGPDRQPFIDKLVAAGMPDDEDAS